MKRCILVKFIKRLKDVDQIIGIVFQQYIIYFHTCRQIVFSALEVQHVVDFLNNFIKCGFLYQTLKHLLELSGLSKMKNLLSNVQLDLF